MKKTSSGARAPQFHDLSAYLFHDDFKTHLAAEFTADQVLRLMQGLAKVYAVKAGVLQGADPDEEDRLAITRLISPAARRTMLLEIDRYGGAEVFFVGHIDRDGMVDRVEALGYGTTTMVPALLSRVRPGWVAIHNHPSGYLRPSDNDLNTSALLGERGAGAYIVDNAISAVRVVVLPRLRRRGIQSKSKE